MKLAKHPEEPEERHRLVHTGAILADCPKVSTHA